MQVGIKYCMQWNYYPTAAGLAEAIRQRFGVEATLIEGSGGVFDVHVDGTQIWNKHDVGRFPEHGEVIEKIEALTGQA